MLFSITIAVSCIIILLYNPIHAATTPNLRLIYKDEDIFYNHDFLSNQISNTNVDWPVTMVFCLNANVDKVKWNIYWGWTVATTMYMRMSDSGSWIWDSDMGTKNNFWYSPYLQQWVRLHLRLYAPNPPDYMTNNSWGKYVIGTTHYDEFWFETWSGYSEYAEEDLASIAAGKGYTVLPDNVWMMNRDYRGNVNNHIWQSDGYATRICVP